MPFLYQKEERPRLYSRLQHFARLNLNKPVSGTDNDVGVGHDETPQAGGSSTTGIQNYILLKLELLFIASYKRKLSEDIKMKNFRFKPVLLAPSGILLFLF